MRFNTMVWTTLVASIGILIALRGFYYFHFINWSPVGWAKRWELFGSSSALWKWTFLFLIIFICSVVYYYLISLTSSIPPTISSLIVSIILAVAIEWSILVPTTLMEGLRSLSYPFLALVAVAIRFITGTAVFMKKLPKEATK
ncbi:magnesium-transporting ATPase (P-type) [Sporosarcina luteola]|nr:magnesium-transporting ATPase (P-type) [Sporosarcina luteola]